MIPAPQITIKSLKKSTSKDSTGNSKSSSAKKEKLSTPPKVFGDRSNITKKGTTLVEPIYPKMPAVQAKNNVQNVPVIGSDIPDGDVITLSGAQLKCLIKDYAKKSIKAELAKVLQSLNGPEDEDDNDF